ncbi:hypothetical protein L6452_33070 [Arctium lappa]|uniref:Uncharacterized protein n=1 Tax=Arctium lappa TaxID=4217 RepID=A0ACB8Z6K1_ARCLA|nr:hypothetical protein L6452_33070 [Arctium lappa]
MDPVAGKSRRICLSSKARQISPTLCLKFGRIVHCLKLVGYCLVFRLKFHCSGDVLDLNVARSKVIFRLDVGSSMVS